MSAAGSRTVDWWAVHEFVVPTLELVQAWPTAGTLAWINLDDRDPAKMAAVLDAARHHALRMDVAQTALAEASRDIAGAADWAQIARETLQRKGAYIRRVAS